MVITNKMKFEPPLIHMGETVIQLKDDIKILGLIVDNRRYVELQKSLGA